MVGQATPPAGNDFIAVAAGGDHSLALRACRPGPTIVMLDPDVMPDDVHTGPSGLEALRVLWSEPVLFDANDLAIADEHSRPVGFTVAGCNSAIMEIVFARRLLHDRYTITVADSVLGLGTGCPIDGDNDGAAGGDALITIEHRNRSDLDNSNGIDFKDLAILAGDWLAKFD